MTQSIFYQEHQEEFTDLIQYVPIVARVHSQEHPEFLKVKEVFDQIIAKLGESPKLPDLADDWVKLQEITSNYQIPDGVCGTYEAVYQMLEALDQAYNNIE